MLRPRYEDEVRRLIHASPTKSCAVDPIPTFPLKEMANALLPYVAAMISASSRKGRLPPSQKHAVVTALPKKLRLDTDELKNYRNVSNRSRRICTTRRISQPGIERVQPLADISRSRYVVIATKPVRRLQIRSIARN